MHKIEDIIKNVRWYLEKVKRNQWAYFEASPAYVIYITFDDAAKYLGINRPGADFSINPHINLSENGMVTMWSRNSPEKWPVGFFNNGSVALRVVELHNQTFAMKEAPSADPS